MICLLNLSRYANNYYKHPNISNIITQNTYNPDELKKYGKLIITCNIQDNHDLLNLLDMNQIIKDNTKIKRELYIPYIYHYNKNYNLTRELLNIQDYHKIYTLNNNDYNHDYNHDINNLHILSPVYFYRWSINNIKCHDKIDMIIYPEKYDHEEIDSVFDKNIVLVCSKINTGIKLNKLCKRLRSYGSKNIYIIATHGIFNNYYIFDDLKQYVNNIYITDSYYHNYDKNFIKIYRNNFSLIL